MELLGYICIAIGILFIVIGMIGVYRFHHFYGRILAAANVDTTGLISILIGVMLVSGWNMFSLKVLLILFIFMILNPIVTSAITSSAYFSGYKLEEKEEEDA